MLDRCSQILENKPFVLSTAGLGNVSGLSWSGFMNLGKILSDQKKPLCLFSGRLASLTLEQDRISGAAHGFCQ